MIHALVTLAVATQVFAEEPIWQSGTAHSGGDGIARFVDFDRDGDMDFLTAAPNPRRWVIYENRDGTIAESPVWESAETSDLDHIDVLDFDADGWPDLAGTHETFCTLYLNREGTFPSEPDWQTSSIANANQIDFADFDADGDTDMVMAAGEPINGVALFANDADGLATAPTLKLGREEYSEAAIFGDYYQNGDAFLDVIAHYPSGHTVVYRNLGGGLDAGMVVFSDPNNTWTQRHYLHDLDSDGQAELFAAKGPWGRNGMSLQLEKFDGLLRSRWTSEAETMIHAFEFADVDGDGDDDVIASDYAHGGRVYIYLNHDGEISTEPDQMLQATGPVHEAVLADIDGDGDLDLAAGGRDQALIFENLSR